MSDAPMRLEQAAAAAAAAAQAAAATTTPRPAAVALAARVLWWKEVNRRRGLDEGRHRTPPRLPSGPVVPRPPCFHAPGLG